MRSNENVRSWRVVSTLLASTLFVVTACGSGSSAQPAQPAPPAAKPTELAKPATTDKPAAPATGGAEIKGSVEGEAKQLNGAGATFPAALYSKWFSEYEKVTGVKVNYQSIGSGGGIKSISDGTVDFGATDGPMTDEQMKAAKGGEIYHVPTALGAVVVTYNLPGVDKPVKFSPDTISGIYQGDIKKWSDAKLKADNPDLSLPDKDIIVVHRSDGSGTTYIFTDYLASVSPTWKSKVGAGTSVKFPTGLGGKGNEGVAGEVKANQYAIGYVELIYALQNKLGVGQVKNKSGKLVEPNVQSVTAAAAGVAQNIAPDLRASIVDAPGEAVYPISGFTWILAYQEIRDKGKATALTRMLWWATHEGQRFNADLGYAPLPEAITKRAEEKISAITTGGQKAFPGR